MPTYLNRSKFNSYFGQPKLIKKYRETTYYRAYALFDWVKDQLVQVSISGVGPRQAFFLHWKVVTSFVSVIKSMRAIDALPEEFSCFWSPRTTGNYGENFSPHSWGIAMDFNASSEFPKNQYGYQRSASDPWYLEQSPTFIQAMEGAGFFWGGRWVGNQTDGMHFEASSDLAENPLVDSRKEAISRSNSIGSKYGILVSDTYPTYYVYDSGEEYIRDQEQTKIQGSGSFDKVSRTLKSSVKDVGVGLGGQSQVFTVLG